MRVVRMRLGDEFIELTEYLTPRGRQIGAGSRSNDRWFQHIAIVVNDMDQAYLWHPRFYFKDPDGHPLEILEFPPDKGAARWHRPTDRIFLGIDHTAIVVGDTDASLRFYRDTLGLTVVGHSENWGHHAAGPCRPCDRVARVPHTARWSTVSAGYAGERSPALANPGDRQGAWERGVLATGSRRTRHTVPRTLTLEVSSRGERMRASGLLQRGVKARTIP